MDDPLAIEQKGEVYYYHADGLGSIAAITDTKQKTVESYSYDSFGTFKRKGDRVKNRYTYTSREWDAEINLYYYRARYYDAKVGRFISRDPIGFRGGDVNLFSYVGQNPVNWTDLWGLYRYSTTAGDPVDDATGKAMTCFEKCSGLDITITAGKEGGHSKGSKHETGQACDVGKNSNPDLTRDTAVKCFKQCFDQSTSYGQEEGNHYHFQTTPGKEGATGFPDGTK